MQLVITVGVVTLVGYVATRVWGNDAPTPPTAPTQGRVNRRRRGNDADVVDVWFEERKK